MVRRVVVDDTAGLLPLGQDRGADLDVECRTRAVARCRFGVEVAPGEPAGATEIDIG